MITEDYVSFEIAKLLKEKGFDERTDTSYIIDNTDRPMVKVGDLIYSPNTEPHRIAAPTLNLARKWLRKAHNIGIEIRMTNRSMSALVDIVKYYWVVLDTRTAKWEDESTVHTPKAYETYEDACESAIKYCLENLKKLF